MKRRDVLVGATAMAAGTAYPAPALTQSRRELKMVTDWPEGVPGLQTSAVRLAKSIEIASDGRIRIEVFAAGKYVRPFETFDAVQTGFVDMLHSAANYFGRKSLASSFFAAVPFGFTADELFAWVRHGGGQELWDELYGRFDIKPFLASNTAAQMGGWFKEEISGPEEFKGLRYRMPGLGAEVLRRIGAIVLLLPGGEIVPALKSGALDASEWIGPWQDMALGLHEAVGYYYYPGFHEPGAGLFLGINRRVWDSFPEGDRRLIESAAAAEYANSLAEGNANNALSLRKLRKDGTVKIRHFPEALLREFHRISKDIVAEAGAEDDLTRKIYASYVQFRTVIIDWSDVAERAFLNARRLA